VKCAPLYLARLHRFAFNSRTRVKFATQLIIYTLNTDGKLVQSFARLFLYNKRLPAQGCVPTCKARFWNARLRINRSYRVRGRSTSVFNTSDPLVLVERARVARSM